MRRIGCKVSSIGCFIKCYISLKKTLRDLITKQKSDDKFEYIILDLGNEDESKDKELLNNFVRKGWKLEWTTPAIDWKKQKMRTKAYLKRKLALSKVNIIVQLYEEMRLFLYKSKGAQAPLFNLSVAKTRF